jgi:wobble nucleotide-excising tRNase
MIESIQISNVATYKGSPESMPNLSKINFLFGSNGSGKTTISRAIVGHPGHEHCILTWRNGVELKTFVYNRDFVEKHFGAAADLPGIFTLGEASVDTIAKLAEAKTAVEALGKRTIEKTESLQGADGSTGFKGRLGALDKKFREACWKQKVKHDEKFGPAFTGARDAMEKFKLRVLAEHANNKASLAPLEELLKRAETVFGEEPTQETPVAAVSGAQLFALESNTVMQTVVMGKQDVDIAAMIAKLGNSDWVKQGRPYFRANESACPFCQQDTQAAFAKSLEEYFDESYLAQTKAIEDLGTAYALHATSYARSVGALLDAQPKFLALTPLRTELTLIESEFQVNFQLLAEKQREPSHALALRSVSESVTAIEKLIDEANAEVAKRNALVTNIKRERITLASQIWRYLLDEELKADLAAYLKEKTEIGKAIESLEGEIKKAREDRGVKEAEIIQLEKTSTSVQPTVDAINGLLAKFGFHGFKLARTAGGNRYVLNRGDGRDAKHSLSEGERTFVTFLYFYHLLQGSDSDVGITANRVVVFDDPVSSLDSEILFIVSSLVKSVFDEARDKTSRIKQVFVLTHNAHFHKEVTFRRAKNRKNVAKDETFWVVHKSGLSSKILFHETNPIKTSYDALWEQIRRPDRGNLSIQNTMRRILESYFKILGGHELHELPERFDGVDKVACASLVSWVNDGSHFTPDDITFVLDQAAVDNYLRIFQNVFDAWGHIEHYRMMMGDSYVEPAVEEIPA